MYDLIIKNGNILDGSGKNSYQSDIGIKDGKILSIAKSLSGAAMIIDAKGLIVTPGFIDSHSHSDNAALTFPAQIEKCEQGITTSIAGQCGGSAAPKPYLQDPNIHSMSAFVRAVNATPQGSNIALFVGHGTIRRAVMGTENRKPTADELSKMKEILKESIQAGALGLSLGLIYTPSCYADTEELTELAKVCKAEGGMLAAHIRNESDTLIEAVEEFIGIAKASGARAVISHHKTCYARNRGKVNTTLKMIDDANKEGFEIYCDVYPYTASSTSVTARFIPKEYRAGGKVLQNLANPDIREKIKEINKASYTCDKIDWALITKCDGHPEYYGKFISDIAKMMGVEDIEAALRLIEISNENCNACFFSMNEEDVETVIKHPRSMICTDSSVVVSDAPYHPRLRASFPRAIRRFVRELGSVSLPEMIRKMTSLPAFVYNLEGKGLIKEGFDADICIFDFEKIQDKAEYANPSLRAEGLNYVIVGGEIVAENSVYTGKLPGRLLVRKTI